MLQVGWGVYLCVVYPCLSLGKRLLNVLGLVNTRPKVLNLPKNNSF